MDGITVTEFARRQGVTRATVYQWMAATPGLRPQQIAGLTLLSAENISQILDRPRKHKGRPLGAKNKPKITLDSPTPSA